MLVTFADPNNNAAAAAIGMGRAGVTIPVIAAGICQVSIVMIAVRRGLTILHASRLRPARAQEICTFKVVCPRRYEITGAALSSRGEYSSCQHRSGTAKLGWVQRCYASGINPRWLDEFLPEVA